MGDKRSQYNFGQAKIECLGKRDKSFAGRIDARAVEICSLINQRPEYFTLSSCSGRAFIYRGAGVKATSNFQRWRISHDLIQDASRFFNLATLDSDPTGGADPLRSIGQFDHALQLRTESNHIEASHSMIPEDQDQGTEFSNGRRPETPETEDRPVYEAIALGDYCDDDDDDDDGEEDQNPKNGALGENATFWLRMEPFILHVACRSLSAASTLMATARPALKNVGITSLNKHKFVVAIWGDEGLELPLTSPSGNFIYHGEQAWLQELVNQRLDRNWSKIQRFVDNVRALPKEPIDSDSDFKDKDQERRRIKSFDVIGDIAIVHSLPSESDEASLQSLGEAILQQNKGIKVCVARMSTLEGTERAPGSGTFMHLAGARRSPLVTSHMEFGIKCIVNLEETFFSPRMGPERLRICQQVARGETVLVLFSGVGMEALQIAGRTEAKHILGIEKNPIAARCAQNAHIMLRRNKAVKCIGAADRLEFLEGDVMHILPTLPRDHFDRILAPRPKESVLDGDLGDGDGGIKFLRALLPVLRQTGGECHWYDL
jgi:tRNA G37 N-methylase Trm5